MLSFSYGSDGILISAYLAGHNCPRTHMKPLNSTECRFGFENDEVSEHKLCVGLRLIIQITNKRLIDVNKEAHFSQFG